MNIRTRTARTFRTMRIEDLEGRMMFAGYSFDVFVDPQTENTQYRLFFDDPQAGVDHFQFGVVEETPAGTIHTRGHPDLSEPNGWGAGWIANVFIAGEGSGPVNGHVDSVVSGTGGIDVVASGSVVSTDGSAGTWTWSSTISCDPATQSVDLDGLTQVTLTGPLAGDMNVGKLHGNFQYHVPLNTGGVGNTGDTREIRFTYGPDSPVRELAFVPTPADPANYPTDCSSDVTVTLVGAINLSDPNHTTIRKPTVHHSVISTDPTTKLVAGAQWDSSANNYWSDNLGASQIVTPANTASTTFEFTVRSFWTLPQMVSDSTIGLYDPATSVFYLRNANDAGIADLAFGYGPGGQGWQRLSGDWNGDSIDTPGIYDPSTSVFYLRNCSDAGIADLAFGYGPGGQGWQPLSGDWNDDGVDSIGLYDPSTGVFYLRNSNDAGIADAAFGYGPGGQGWQPFSGDWNGDGVDTPGMYAPVESVFYLRNSNDAGIADAAFGYGPGGQGWLPLVGDWNGSGSGASLLVAGDKIVAAGPSASLTQADLQPIVAQAIADCASRGLATDELEALVAVQFVITDLPGSQLGRTWSDTIFLDLDAAGHGWFVDPTPGENEEFQTVGNRLEALDPAAVDRIDLMTVVSHEIAHTLGLDDLDSSLDRLMSGTLETGVRREVGPAEIDAVLGNA